MLKLNILYCYTSIIYKLENNRKFALIRIDPGHVEMIIVNHVF